MSNNTLLKQIGDLIDKKLDSKLKPFKNQLSGLKNKLDDVELKVEVVNNRVSEMDKRLSSRTESVEKELKQAIEKSQEDTIQALSDLMHSGYDERERRIKYPVYKLFCFCNCGF